MKIFLNEKIHLSGLDWVPSNSSEIALNIEELLKAIRCFYYYRDAKIYYSGEGVLKLISNFEELDSINDYALTNPIGQIRVVLFETNAINWDESKKQKEEINYYYQLSGGAAPQSVKATTLAEATEYKYNGALVGVLNLLSSEYNGTSPIHINRSSINPPPLMQILELDIFSTKAVMTGHIKTKRAQRVFNLNPKHGENGIGVRANKNEVVSPLECNRNEAELILNNAVGTENTDELYGYDSVRKKFMVFKNEGNNHFHGYHPIDQKDVPEEVKRFLREEN